MYEKIIITVLILAALITSPVAADKGVLSGSIRDDIGMTGWNEKQEVVEYDGNPSFLIYHDEEDQDKLESWLNGSEEREMRHDGDGYALVSTPKSHIWHDDILQYGSTGLFKADYINHIAYNINLRLEPVPESENYNGISLISKLRAGVWKYSTSGVATMSETEEHTVEEVEDYMDVNNSKYDGEGADVAILDTGVNYKGSIYGDVVKSGKNFYTGNTINASADNYTAVEDGNKHGSWVASAVHEIAPNSSLHIGKVLEDDGSGTTASIVEGIEWACSKEVDVLSMSLGSPVYASAMTKSLEECKENDITAYIAAGNSRNTVRWVSSPSDAPLGNVITVAASTPANNSTAETAYFSQVGPDPGVMDSSHGRSNGQVVDLTAPGMNLTTKIAIEESGTTENKTLSGTSMSTPIVAGIGAIVEHRTGMQGEDLKERMKTTALRTPKIGETEAGAGMPSLQKAINDNSTDKSQSEVRESGAVARDKFNRGLSGNAGDSFGILERLRGYNWPSIGL